MTHGIRPSSTRASPGPYLVVGLARSGAAAARLLARRGEPVIGVDSGSPTGADELREQGVEVALGTDGLAELESAATVIKSPGVPREAAVVAGAVAAGKTVIGELELAWRLLPNRFVAVTGTNGKTTVVELLGHIWRVAGEPVAVAGNVGTPLVSLVGEVDAAATIVCEASSFQLEDASAFAPECGVLLNLAPDHLDRHGSLDAYRDAKLRLFAHQVAEDVCVFDGSDRALAGVELGGAARRVDFSRAIGGSETSLLGAHNAANAAAAAAAAEAMGIGREAIAAGLASFPGVSHRLERVAERDGVLFVNDSKATNVAAATAALRSFDGGVHAILGGSLKGGGFAGLAEPVVERCAATYLIGDAADELERELAPDTRARRRDPPQRRSAGRGERRGGGGEGRARSSSWPRPAPVSMPTATSRSEASISGPW